MKSSLPRMELTVAGVGRKAALEDHAGFHVLEAGDLLLQLHVDAHGAGDGSHRARTHAEGARGGQRRLNQLGVVGQAQIIVAGQVDHLLAVVVAHRRLLIVEDAQFEVGALGAQFVERGGQVGKLGAGSGVVHRYAPQSKRITPPAAPLEAGSPFARRLPWFAVATASFCPGLRPNSGAAERSRGCIFAPRPRPPGQKIARHGALNAKESGKRLSQWLQCASAGYNRGLRCGKWAIHDFLKSWSRCT